MSVTAAHLPALAIDHPVSPAATALSLPVLMLALPLALMECDSMLASAPLLALDPAGAAAPSRQVSITRSPDFRSLSDVAALPSTGSVRLSWVSVLVSIFAEDDAPGAATVI